MATNAATTTDKSKLNWPRWQQALLIAVLVVLIGNRMMLVVDTFALRAGLSGDIPYDGAQLNINEVSDDGFLKVANVEPDSPAAQAGVRSGDMVRPERSYDYLVRRRIGDQVNFTLDHGGVRSLRQVIVEAAPQSEENSQRNTMLAVNALGLLISMLIGCLILWRGWGNRSAMAMGTALACLGVGGMFLPPWASAAVVAIPMWALVLATVGTANIVILFAMRMVEDCTSPLPRWQWRAAYIWLALVALYYVLTGTDSIALTKFSELLGGRGGNGLLISLSVLASNAILIAGWRKAAPADRNRLALLIFALAAYLAGAVVTGWNQSQTGVFLGGSGTNWPSYLVALLMSVIVPILLAYAVLRHRMFDMGFAINRTLIFATISTVLLVSFAVIEWAVEHTIPESWREGGAFFSAGIAVGLFLLFHRIRDAVEHFIERLFFRKWQENEEKLKRFVASAAHVERPEALAGQFAGELARFSGSAAVSLYLRDAEGNYAHHHGETIDADDPALTAMRAELGAVVPGEVNSALTGVLALPMMNQAMLAGFVLLGSKPTGEDYRPDEIEILSWAVRHVGLDLQAIRTREMEQLVITLEVRNAELAGVLERAAAKA